MIVRNASVGATDPGWPSGAELLAEGAALAGDWAVQPRAFLETAGVASEAAYKREAAAAGRIMQHAQVGYRDAGKTRRAFAEIYEACSARGVTVDRYGICLDWSMAVPRDNRADAQMGTGLILATPEDFIALGEAAPVAPHFGDFVLGFPAALENTQAALVAGSTAIGNLGQYFTFRTPGRDDDVEATTATLRAIGLIAAQDVEVMVHSNLDDGFAAQFTDLTSCLGAVLLEQFVVGGHCGATVSHCFGHHFSDPLRRLAFQLALTEVSDAPATPGTMIYGNTMGYRGGPAENYANLASYLLTDILGQRLRPSGHAINPVPVMENQRIPDIDEIVDAQLFAHRMVEEAEGISELTEIRAAQAMADQIVAGGRAFKVRVLEGLDAAGVDIDDPFQVLITLRRTGGHGLEALFGGRDEDAGTPRVRAGRADEIDAMARAALEQVPDAAAAQIRGIAPVVVTASTDVHAHGKMVLDAFFGGLGARVIDGGMTASADTLAKLAMAERADAVAVSTYNGVALDFATALLGALDAEDSEIPVLIGGRLNQIPTGSNTSLPVDVTSELAATGCIVCRDFADALPVLMRCARHTENRLKDTQSC